MKKLSRREGQIMDIIFQKGQATAQEVLELLPNPPGNATVRKLLKILEDKGHLKHEKKGAQFVYSPTMSQTQARDSAFKHLVNTFFQGSAEKAMLALMQGSESKLSKKDQAQISKLIEQAQSRGQ